MSSPRIAPIQPALDGSITGLPSFVDFHAEHNATLPWVLLVPEHAGETTAIPFAEFSNATHRAAHAIQPIPSTGEREVIALLLNCDAILYLALLAGIIRAGLVPLPCSHQDSVAAVANLLEKANCHRIICSSVYEPFVAKVKAELAEKSYLLRIDALPELHAIFPDLSGSITETTPYPKVRRPYNPDDVVIILHSSGSTGFPKPVPQRQRDVLNWFGTHTLLEGRKRGIIWGSMALPTPHTMAMYMQFYYPLSTGYPVALYYPKAPAPPVIPTPQNMLETCKRAGVSGIPMVPAFIEVWARSDEDVAYLATLDVMVFAGGPLSEANGNKLVKAGVKLFCVYGGTEFGVHTRIFDADEHAGPESDVKSKEDWAWLTFQDTINPRWVPQGDGTYELQLLECKTHSTSIQNIPDVPGYATNDLFVPHPTKKGLWRVTGRKDDILILTTGKNVVPLPQEGSITASHMVHGALMFGHGKQRCGVLIEPVAQYVIDPKDPQALAEFRDKIWPVVDEANRLPNVPMFSQIPKELILVADPARPLPRAAKRTILRKQAYTLYADDIEKLYATNA